MRTIFLGIVLLGLTTQAFAQDVIYEVKIDRNQVPRVIVNSVGQDFPGYSVVSYKANPLELIEGDVVVNRDIMSAENYDAYDIELIGKGRELILTYDRNGNLLSSTEHMKNFTPTAAIRNAISMAYPGWTIEQDARTVVHYQNGQKRERYRLVLSKNDKKIKIYTDDSGKILTDPKIS